jgi:NAD(P)-dependent dehydrogenase (short-subunit alcohol dehydrogenase family)
MALEGAHVVVNYIGQPGPAEEVLHLIKNNHGVAIVIAADVSKADQVQHMISETVSRLGRIDVLANNAGIEKKTPFLEKPESESTRCSP